MYNKIKEQTVYNQKIRILCIGDSITFGTGSTPGNSYPRILCSCLSQQDRVLTVVNRGRPGFSTKEYWEYLNSPEFKVSSYHGIIVMLGTNDCRRDNWVETEDSMKYLRNITGSLNNMLEKDGKIYICTILPLADPMPQGILGAHHGWAQYRVEKEMNPSIQRLAHELGINFIDVHAAFAKKLKESEVLYDGIHPYDAGYRLIAETIAEAVLY